MLLTLLAFNLGAAALTPSARAAPCCSGSGSGPVPLVSGDDQGRVTASVGYTAAIGDAPPEGRAVFRAASDSETTRALTLSGAWLLSDRWQAGASLPLVSRRVARGSAAVPAESLGAGDARVFAAYEAFPVYTYSPYRPVGHAYAALTLPTGRSIREADAVDATGEGFVTGALGLNLDWRWSGWDAACGAEARLSGARRFEREAAVIRPGFGFLAWIGAGFSPGGGAWRLGARLSPLWRQSWEVFPDGGGNDRVPARLVWTSTAELSWAVNEHSSLALAYDDQTLAGPAVNSELDRTVALSFTRRWLR